MYTIFGYVCAAFWKNKSFSGVFWRAGTNGAGPSKPFHPTRRAWRASKGHPYMILKKNFCTTYKKLETFFVNGVAKLFQQKTFFQTFCDLRVQILSYQ